MRHLGQQRQGRWMSKGRKEFHQQEVDAAVHIPLKTGNGFRWPFAQPSHRGA